MKQIKAESVDLMWDKPKYDGGSPIEWYIVEKKDDKRNNWVETCKVPSYMGCKTKVPKLWEGCKYHFRVAAQNQSGLGPFAQTDLPITTMQPFGISILNEIFGNNYHATFFPHRQARTSNRSPSE